jgi:hypothetical protein
VETAAEKGDMAAADQAAPHRVKLVTNSMVGGRGGTPIPTLYASCSIIIHLAQCSYSWELGVGTSSSSIPQAWVHKSACRDEQQMHVWSHVHACHAVPPICRKLELEIQKSRNLAQENEQLLRAIDAFKWVWVTLGREQRMVHVHTVCP